MNIKEIMAAFKARRRGISFAFLAERTETSADSPYRIKPAGTIRPDETLVCVIGGSGGKGDHIREYNGYLKQTDTFIKNVPELKGKPVRVCVAVCNFGDFHHDRLARRCLYYSAQAQSFDEVVAGLSAQEKEETLKPAYIRDIFEQTLLPRISTEGGKKRLPAETAARYVRKANFVTHCHGAYVARELEKLTSEKMKNLGYSPAEQKLVLSRLMVLNYAPDCPYIASASSFVSIESVADDHNQLQTAFKEFLQMTEPDFGLCRLPSRGGNVFMCAKIDKSGIEGNPPKAYKLVPVEEFWDKLSHRDEADDSREPEDNDTADEHSFLGFAPKSNMSRGALKMQHFANNILKNAVLNSLAQSRDETIPLPDVKHLAAQTRQEKFAFARAYLTGYQLSAKFLAVSKKKLMQFINWHQNSRIELD